MPNPIFEIIPATIEVRAAVIRVVARQMAQVLARFPTSDLRNEELCNERLHRAGFASTSIFHVASEARCQAREILEQGNTFPDARGRNQANRIAGLGKRAAKAVALALIGLYVLAPFRPGVVSATANEIGVAQLIEIAIATPVAELVACLERDAN